MKQHERIDSTKDAIDKRQQKNKSNNFNGLKKANFLNLSLSEKELKQKEWERDAQRPTVRSELNTL